MAPRAEAVGLDLEAAKVSLTAEVASAYMSLRDVQTRVAPQREDAHCEARVVSETRLRVQGGTASQFDLERLDDQLRSTRAEVAPPQAETAGQLDRMTLLTGREPGALDAELAAVAPPPPPPANVAVGDPAALLRRRPDVRAAERRFQADNAAIGQHTADPVSKVIVFGASDFGRVRSRIDRARGRTAEVAATYRSVVLSALQDAETSPAADGRQRERVAALLRAQASAEPVSRLTAIRVQGGTAALIDPLDAERRRVAVLQAVAVAQVRLTLDYVALQKSSGLGWEPPPGEARLAPAKEPGQG